MNELVRANALLRQGQVVREVAGLDRDKLDRSVIQYLGEGYFPNILDGRFLLLLVNPRHVKQVPGRKSDVSDAEWIAQLLQCGLLRGSFVPRRELRQLRDLTRFRAQLAGEQTRLALRRTICQQYRDEARRLHAVILDPDLEQELSNWAAAADATPHETRRVDSSLGRSAS